MDKDMLTTFDDEALDHVSGGGDLADRAAKLGSAIGGAWGSAVEDHLQFVGAGIAAFGVGLTEFGNRVKEIAGK